MKNSTTAGPIALSYLQKLAGQLSSRNDRHAWLLLVALCGFLFFFQLGARDLLSSHEARAAQDAQSVLSGPNWELPRLFDRRIEMQKPPLYYWLAAACAWLIGRPVDTLTVRLPAAAAAMAGVLIVWSLLCGYRRAMAGLVAGVALATTIHYVALARTARIDMPLTAVIAAGLYGYYRGYRSVRAGDGSVSWYWFVMLFMSQAAAILLKGPIGPLLTASTILTHVLVEEGWRSVFLPGNCLRLMKDLRLWWGLPLVLLLTLPWFWWANHRTAGEFFRVFFWEHNFDRGLGGGRLRGHPWWQYFPQLVYLLLPWSCVLPYLAWTALRRKWWRMDAEARFGCCWFLAMVGCLSLASFKRADYLLPAFPGAALFIGATAEHAWDAAGRPRSWIRGLVCSVLLVAAGLVAYWSVWLPRQDERNSVRTLAGQIREWSPAPQLVIFFRTESHPLAFHVGEPIDTILEWENLDVWAARPETYYVVMPAEFAREWPEHLKAGQMEEVTVSTVLAGAKHDDPLVVLRTKPGAGRVGR